MGHPATPPRFCVCCGDAFALHHCKFCPTCQLAALRRRQKQVIQRQHDLHTKHQRIRAQSARSARAAQSARSAKAQDFAASGKAIARQLAWMQANHLLPDSRRPDFNPATAPLRRR